MAGESRSPPLSTGSAPAATGGALEGPQSAPPVLSSTRLIWVLGPPVVVTSTSGPRMGRWFLPELFPAPSCTRPLPKPVSTFQHEAGMFPLSYF